MDGVYLPNGAFTIDKNSFVKPENEKKIYKISFITSL
jgi:hypothetical protein